MNLWVTCIAAIIITQRTVKLPKWNIAAVCARLGRTVCIAVVAVQLIVRVIVIQCGADILCVGLGRKSLAFQLYNTLGLSVFSFFAFFYITDNAQRVPIAAAVAALVDYIIAGVGVEARLVFVRGNGKHCSAIAILCSDFIIYRPRCKADFCIALRHIDIPNLAGAVTNHLQLGYRFFAAFTTGHVAPQVAFGVRHTVGDFCIVIVVRHVREGRIEVDGFAARCAPPYIIIACIYQAIARDRVVWEYCYFSCFSLIIIEIEVLLTADVSTICLLKAYIGAGCFGDCDARLLTRLQSIDSLRSTNLFKIILVILFPECDGDLIQCLVGIIQQHHLLAAIADMLEDDGGVVNPFSNVVLLAYRRFVAAYRQFIAVKAFVGDIFNKHPALIVLPLSIHLNPMVFIQCKFNPDKAAIGT